MRILPYIVVLAFVACFAGCAPSRPGKLTARKPVAGAYGDSTLPKWRAFFGDTTLVNLIDTALKNNPDLQIALERTGIAASELYASRMAILPRSDLRVAAGQRRFGDYTMDGVGNYDTRLSPNITRDQFIPEHLPDLFAGLQSTWEIDIWKKLRNSRKAALERFFQQDDARRMVVSNLVAAVAATYYELLALDNELAILDEFIVLAENAEEIISYQKLAGQATELAVRQFVAQTLNSRTLRIEAEQRIVEAENRLNYLLGRFPSHVPRQPQAFNDSLQALPETIPARLLGNRPDVAQAEHLLAEAKLNVAVARASFYPSLSLDAMLGYQTFNPKFFFSPVSLTYNVLGAIAAPLINRSRLQADLGIAGSRQRIAVNEYRKSAVNAYSEVAVELSAVRRTREMRLLKTREAEAASEAVDIANSLFRTGRATYLEVIITRRNALLTKLELVKLRERSLKAAVGLYKALGGGWR